MISGMTPDTGRVVVAGLTKDFGRVRAVDGLSFAVEPSTVTTFLGPNGAGKTTTLRMLLGLVQPTAGTATIGGRAYAQIPEPLRVVGASLEATNFHPGRSALDHLRVQCRAGGLPVARAEEVLGLVGLEDAGKRRVQGFSLGMRQRLALGSALLGDPQVLLLDEPANGLDPEGIAWLRGFLRHLAATGRTVLVSSHVLAEVAQIADRVIVVDRARLVRDSPLSELTSGAATTVRVVTPDAARLTAALTAAGLRVAADGDSGLVVHAEAPAVGRIALREGVELHELTPERADLEQVFLTLTSQGGSR